MSKPTVVISIVDGSFSSLHSTARAWHIDAVRGRPPHQICSTERPALRFGHQAALGISDRTLRKCRRYDPRARARAYMSENYRTIEGLADAGIAVAADRRRSPHNRDDGRLRRATGDNRADDLAGLTSGPR